jgi:iron-sulfur cluster assembly accessory protein
MDSQISAAGSAQAPAIASAPFAVTDSAAARIVKITIGEPEGSRFRISIKGGGCSGFQYIFDFDASAPADTDMIIEKNGASVIIDDVSLGLLAGSTLDYIETLGSAGFEIKNPNATASCGCGSSFSV